MTTAQTQTPISWTFGDEAAEVRAELKSGLPTVDVIHTVRARIPVARPYDLDWAKGAVTRVDDLGTGHCTYYLRVPKIR